MKKLNSILYLTKTALFLALLNLSWTEPAHAVQLSMQVAQVSPASPETDLPVPRLVLGETIFPYTCDLRQGELTPQDEAIPGLNGMRYDGYSIHPENGTLMFIEMQSREFSPSVALNKITAGEPPRVVANAQGELQTRYHAERTRLDIIKSLDRSNVVSVSHYFQAQTRDDYISLRLGTSEDNKFGAYTARIVSAVARDNLEPKQIEQAVKALGQDEIRQLVSGICDRVTQRKAALRREAEQLEGDLKDGDILYSNGGNSVNVEKTVETARRLVEIYREIPPENPLAIAKALQTLLRLTSRIGISGSDDPNERDRSGTVQNPDWVNGEPIAKLGYMGGVEGYKNSVPIVQELSDILAGHEWKDRKDASQLAGFSEMIGNFFEAGGSLESAQYWYLRSLYFRLWGGLPLTEKDNVLRVFSLPSALVRTFVRQDRLYATAEASDRAVFLNQFEKNVDFTIGLHLQVAPNDETMAKIAYATILNRKGRLLDASANNLRLLRSANDPEVNELLDERAKLVREISNANTQSTSPDIAMQSGVGEGVTLDKAAIDAKRAQLSQIQAQLETRSARFRAQYKAVTLNDLQAKIPSNAALVEFFKYRWQNKDYYGAYIFRGVENIEGIALGEASQIEATAKEFYDQLAGGNTPEANIKESGKALYAQVMQPIARRLKAGERLLISPDGVLNSIPFEALVDQNGSYLIEHYSFSYLASARDLMRLPNPGNPSATRPLQPPVLVGNPNYTQAGNVALSLLSKFPQPNTVPAPPTIAQIPTPEGSLRGSSTPSITTLANFPPFDPVPNSNEEIDAIHALPQMRDAAVLRGADATESVLKQVQAPRILHISTHGFYLSKAQVVQPIENPLERSGLAFAGFNQFKSGDDNGMLTALELSELDLEGTQLVVLSACETGLGDVEEGEGVYGFRRALSLAGAESQVVSLWKVRGDSTEELMKSFYTNLFQQPQLGRHEALRQAQLTMLHSGSKSNPYHWAAFVPVGNWNPIGN